MTSGPVLHGARETLISNFSPRLCLSAIILGIAIPIHLLLPDVISRMAIAITISLIAGAYIGFGARDGRPGVFIIELIAAGIFGFMAFLGVVWTPYMFAVALFAHGFWDLLHHNSLFGAMTPKWYIPFCVVVDWLAAAGLAIMLLI